MQLLRIITQIVTIYLNFIINFSACGINRLDGNIKKYFNLDVIDEQLQEITSKQTELGFVQNRLEITLEEISIHYENLTSSRSTLKDADIADVSSEYIRQQILQQASATLLSTANQIPSIALGLL